MTNFLVINKLIYHLIELEFTNFNFIECFLCFRLTLAQLSNEH